MVLLQLFQFVLFTKYTQAPTIRRVLSGSLVVVTSARVAHGRVVKEVVRKVTSFSET